MILGAEVLEFGEALVTTGDLDPIYNYLYEQKFEPNRLKRWLLTYSMFYHAGVANKASCQQGYHYWDYISSGIPAQPVGFPRSEERRHFRGHTATEAIEFMSQYEPESIVDSWYKEPDFPSVIANVQKLKYYGPWIAFKLADMGERCLGLPINFSGCELNIYREPRMGAALVMKGDKNAQITASELSEVIEYITSNLNAKGLLAPPINDRPLNVQEAETILCKFKSMKGGHYYVGKDIEAVEKALKW